MLASYVWADLWRNPRRTLSTMVGVCLGVGLFCGVLFFVDGLSASMTQRAVAPLTIDMQRVMSGRFAGAVSLEQRTRATDDPVRTEVVLTLVNAGEFAANEVTVRSVPGTGVTYVAGSATAGSTPIAGSRPGESPFAAGVTQAGHNLGTVPAGASVELAYTVQHRAGLAEPPIESTFSTREMVNPVLANRTSSSPLADLAGQIAAVRGVAQADALSIGDLGPDALAIGGRIVDGPSRVFGFDAALADRDPTVRLVTGRWEETGAVVSAEAATAISAEIGDTVSIALPDDERLDIPITGIADLSAARSLFSSRRGGDLETFQYVPSSVVVGTRTFADAVFPAFERAATDASTRLKSPPIREVDITLDRELLAADPATAAEETVRIAADVEGIDRPDDYLLDNISNTLTVAADDARVAKRLFVFLGLPGALLAAMLAAYAGNVLAEAQRREQATLRIRGADRRLLLRMLALHTALLTAAGSIVGLAIGFLATRQLLGAATLARASTTELLTSAMAGTTAGFVATGAALYVTARRSVDREINEDRWRLTVGVPLWRRAHLDVAGIVVVAAATALAVRASAFDGASGSVYFGRSVELNLPLLVLPVTVWVSGALVSARVWARLLRRLDAGSRPGMTPLVSRLVRASAARRPWPIANGAIIVALVVALTTTLGAFTSSYDAAKNDDARFATGADIRLTQSPAAGELLEAGDVAAVTTDAVRDVTPVVFAPSNVILRSDRTSDPANLAAVDPEGFGAVAPLVDDHFVDASAADALASLGREADALWLSVDMASFLKTGAGDRVEVLLARATEDQTLVEMRVQGLFERLPGFPDGADALMALAPHLDAVPTKAPDFFLADARDGSDTALDAAVASLEAGPQATFDLRIDTRATNLARDQSSLAALNIDGLVSLDGVFALAMAGVAMAIFVFGLLLHRRREYVTLRAEGVDAGSVRRLIAAETAGVAVGGALAGVLVGAAMGAFFVRVLSPLFVLSPAYVLPPSAAILPTLVVTAAAVGSALVGARLVQGLDPVELLRDD